MINRNFVFILIFVIFFSLKNYVQAAPFDELPLLKKLNDYKIGERRVLKALKYESRGKYKKAQKLYSEALKFLLLANKQTPASPAIYFYLGFTSKKLKKLIDAELYYLVGIELDPNNTKINNHLGQLFLETDRFAEAKKILTVLKNCKCEDFEELQTLIEKN